MAPDYDVLVIGAGPAGSAAARRAAAHGLSVGLVDRSDFPRDKACGDALMPDALQAISDLGVSSQALPIAQRASGVKVYAPNGTCVRLATQAMCVPRFQLDEALKSAAVEAGATFFPHRRVLAPLFDGQSVVGARFADAAGEVTIRAGATILATGASAGPLKQFGVCRRSSPSATAARLYVEVDAATAASFEDLVISYDASICPGYGWIFPGPHRTFNVGVGYFYDARRRPERGDLRVLLDKFLRTFPPAITLMQAARSVTPLRGAPLRTAMVGADYARPGLLLAGEAAGLTYSLTGEGIGKAMQSGMLAADLIASHYAAAGATAARIAADYDRALARQFGARFRAYKTAQTWITSPALSNLIAWRANSGRFVKGELEALLADSGDPLRLFSIPGLARALWR